MEKSIVYSILSEKHKALRMASRLCDYAICPAKRHELDAFAEDVSGGGFTEKA